MDGKTIRRRKSNKTDGKTTECNVKWKAGKVRLGRSANIDKAVEGLWRYFPLKAEPLRP